MLLCGWWLASAGFSKSSSGTLGSPGGVLFSLLEWPFVFNYVSFTNLRLIYLVIISSFFGGYFYVQLG